MFKNLTQKEKVTLAAVAGILIIFLAYYFGFTRFRDKADITNDECVVLQARLNELNEMKDKTAQYKKETKIYNESYDDIISNYDSGFSQKASLLFTTVLEQEVDVWMKSVSLPDAKEIFTFGNITSSNPARTGEKVYRTDMVAYQKDMNFTYECDYDNLKELLSYIKELDTHYVVDSISCSYDHEERIVSGNIVVTQYAIVSKDRPYYETDIPFIETGAGNLFADDTTVNPNSEFPSELYMMTGYDLAVTLSPYGSDLSTVVVGRRALVSSQISANSEEEVPVVITVRGEKGTYTVSYSVGEDQYPAVNYEEGVPFNPGRHLDLIIFSSPRVKGGNDKSGALITINNYSDKNLNYKVVNDDTLQPRYHIVETTGVVIKIE